jgi:soluble cytochrome b562
MNNRIILMACAALVAAPVLRAEDTPLAEQMGAMNDAYKAFRKETDPAKGAALAREAQAALVKGLAETPEMVAKMPDGPDKAKAGAAYRKMMGKLYVTLCEVEEAFLAGKTEEVAKLVEAMKEMKKAGHDKFMEDE